MQSVSIIIPMYNSSLFIEKAIDSVLNQYLEDFEIVVVDDASSDSSVDFVKSYKCSKIKLIQHKRNLGPGAARNTALKNASKDFIALLDADDSFLPGRLEKLLGKIHLKGYDAIADNILVQIDNKEHLKGRHMFHNLKLKDDLITLKNLIDGSDFTNSIYPLGYLKPVFRSHFLRQRNLSYNDTLKVSQDYLFLAEFLACNGVLGFYDEALYLYRRRKGSNSHRISSEKWRQMILCDFSFYKKYYFPSSLKDSIIKRFNWLCDMFFYSVFVESLKAKRFYDATALLILNPRFLSFLHEPFLKRIGFFKDRP
jgi:succinoglycan biosynthesis protein ExoO